MLYATRHKAIILSMIILAAILGTTFTNRGERNANLEIFYALTQSDPLFYDSTLELEKFNAALANLQSKEDDFLKFHTLFLDEKNEEIFPRNRRLYPIDFLEEVSSVTTKTSLFLEKLTFSNAKNLLHSYARAASAYKQNVELQLSVFDNMFKQEPELAIQQISFLGSGTTLEIIKNDFLLIQENAEALEQEIEQRKNCLLHGECASLGKTPHFSSTGGKIPGVRASLTPGIEELISPGGKLLPLDIAAPFPDYDKVLGPYIVETGCFGANPDGSPKNQAFYLFIKNGLDGTPDKIVPKLATENYYIDYEGWPHWKLAKLFSTESRFDRLLEIADYNCADLTYWAKLFNNELRALPYFIDNVTMMLEFLILEQQINQKSTDKRYLMSAKVDHSIFFLPFSKSVWRVHEQPQYLLKKSFSLNKGFKTYTSLREQEYGDEEIKLFNFNQKEVMRDFLNKNKRKDSALGSESLLNALKRSLPILQSSF